MTDWFSTKIDIENYKNKVLPYSDYLPSFSIAPNTVFASTNTQSKQATKTSPCVTKPTDISIIPKAIINQVADKGLVVEKSDVKKAQTQQKSVGMTDEKMSKYLANELKKAKTPEEKQKIIEKYFKDNDTSKDIPTLKKKTGDSVDERMKKYFSKEYKNAKTPEDRQKLIGKYFKVHYGNIKNMSHIDKVKMQLADYKKMLANTTDPESAKNLSASIDALSAEIQGSAGRASTVEQTSPILRASGEVGVAMCAHKCDKRNQKALTEIVAKSKNVEAILIASVHTSQLDKANQLDAVQAYQNTGICDEAQKLVNINTIDQYKSFAKENQVAIHEIMSSSKFSETVEYAAKNIYQFDKSNQAAAVQITANTGNERAITAASAQWAKYDKTAQSEIKTIISNTNCNEAKITLVSAELAEKNKATASSSTVTSSSSTISSSEQNSTDAKIQKIETLIKTSQKPSVIAREVSNLSKNEILTLLQRCPNADVIKAVLSTNSSMDILAKIDESYIKEIGYKNVLPYLCFLGANAQTYVVNECIQNGALGDINRSYLADDVKTIYDKALNEKENNKIN